VVSLNHFDISGLFEKYKTDVFRFALSFLRDTHSAQDITQEVFLSLIQNQAQIKNGARVKSWLMTTTRNLSLNVLNKRGRESADSDKSLDELPVRDESDFEFFAMIDCVEEIDRQIITLHIVTGLKHSQIARIVDLKPGTVRQRYARALKTIKENGL
jgi:RNA polymerase sigma-70 factor (ECF subfamily)